MEELNEDEIIDPAQILDEYGLPVEAPNPRKWLAWLLTGLTFGCGVGQFYWAVSIATTQMVGVYHRWKHDNYLPMSPSIFGLILIVGTVVWVGRNREQYSKTERRVMYWAGVLAFALGAIGLMMIGLIEPYHDAGS